MSVVGRQAPNGSNRFRWLKTAIKSHPRLSVLSHQELQINKHEMGITSFFDTVKLGKFLYCNNGIFKA